jgi:hypothetical protein
MNYRLHLIQSSVFFLCVLLFISCSGTPADNVQLEITSLRYESSETSRCIGEIKNISQQPLSNLKVEVEFKTDNGGRVRGSIVDLPKGALAPSASVNFSVPYIKGPNDSQVNACGVLKVKTEEGSALLHIERRAK